MPAIRIQMGQTEVIAELRDTPTAKAVLARLPFESVAQTWGEEVYFQTPVDAPSEPNAKTVLELGEIAFWLAGNCIAIAYGETPVSAPGEIRLASAANVFADAKLDVAQLRRVRDGERIRVEAV